VSETVFILGAGASVAAGAPVMGNFITTSQNILRRNQLTPKERENFELVFKARALLQQVHSKSELNINNIESLFGTFDMAVLLGKLGNLSTEEVDRLPESMSCLIARTIEISLKYPVTGNERTVGCPAPYYQFAQLIRDVDQRQRGSVSIITFNYDLALDYALFFSQMPFNYCCDPLKDSSKRVDVLKLHGSLNWYRCNKCNEVRPLKLEDFFARRQWSPTPASTAILEVSNYLVHLSCPSCGSQITGGSVIVPPTWNKGKFHTGLSLVWRAAASHLAKAENVFVIGYSLPDTDEFFRYLYALGTVGDSIFNIFAVVDPDARVSERFKKVLGPIARECFLPMEKTFAQAIPEIGGKLGIPSR
jgi:NAD-dependent SIR2 family protein deacetylase